MYQQNKMMSTLTHPEHDSDALLTDDHFYESDKEREGEGNGEAVDKGFVVKLEPGSNHEGHRQTSWTHGGHHSNSFPSGKDCVQCTMKKMSDVEDFEDNASRKAQQLHSKGFKLFEDPSKSSHTKIMQALKQHSSRKELPQNDDSFHSSSSFSHSHCASSERGIHCDYKDAENEEKGRVYNSNEGVFWLSRNVTSLSSRKRMAKQIKSFTVRHNLNSARSRTPVSMIPRQSVVDRPHVCLYCSSAFADFNNLKRHMTYTHRDKSRSAQAEAHIKSIKGSVTCDVCGRVFARPSRLARHKLVHTGQKPFVCDVCNKGFSQSGNLKTHMMLHTGRKPYACDLCGKAFRDSGNLKKHQVIHTGDKPFVCDICDKAFVESGHLKRHKKIHTGQKPYACDVCGKAFIEGSTLRRHKIQTNHNPIICFICNKSFLDAGGLEEHQKIHADENA